MESFSGEGPCSGHLYTYMILNWLAASVSGRQAKFFLIAGTHNSDSRSSFHVWPKTSSPRQFP